MFLRPPGLSDLATCTQLPFYSFRSPLRTSFSGLFLCSGTLPVDSSVASRVPKSPTSVQLAFVALLDPFYHLCIQRGGRCIQEAATVPIRMACSEIRWRGCQSLCCQIGALPCVSVGIFSADGNCCACLSRHRHDSFALKG